MTSTELQLSPPDPPLQDEILLRPWVLSDLAAIRKALMDPEISQWISLIPYPYTDEEGKKFLTRAEQRWAKKEGAPFAIVDASNSRLLGALWLNPEVDDPEIVEAGYWVTKDARRQGIATRALRLETTWILTNHPVARVYLSIHPDNVASIRVAEKAGFQKEGLLRLGDTSHGHRHDVAYYSFLRSDLQKTRTG